MHHSRGGSGTYSGLVASLQVLNALIWLTWSPVGNTVSRVFGWGDLIIVLLNGIGTVFLTACAPLSAWVIGALGMSTAHELSTFYSFTLSKHCFELRKFVLPAHKEYFMFVDCT